MGNSDLSHSNAAHHKGDLGPDAFLIIGVKRASYCAARAALFHYLGSQNYLCVQRGGFQKLDRHGSRPTGRKIGLAFHVHTLLATFQGESGPGRVAINQSAGDTAIEISRIGTVMRLRPPSAHGLVSFQETLDLQPVRIIRAASVTVPYGRLRMEAILQRLGIVHNFAP
jgi:hypothetical protein